MGINSKPLPRCFLLSDRCLPARCSLKPPRPPTAPALPSKEWKTSTLKPTGADGTRLSETRPLTSRLAPTVCAPTTLTTGTTPPESETTSTPRRTDGLAALPLPTMSALTAVSSSPSTAPCQNLISSQTTTSFTPTTKTTRSSMTVENTEGSPLRPSGSSAELQKSLLKFSQQPQPSSPRSSQATT